MPSKYDRQSIRLHKKLRGKLEVASKLPIRNKEDLSVAYTPGVAAVCQLIAKNKENVFTHTLKSNTVAVVTDGSAVLGLGNIGPEAALPVMEGKSVLFKKFGKVDAFPICLATQDAEEIIKTVKLIAPAFGGINLEDIAAPRCFEVEERLKKELSIPVFHDDQHGTAIVVLAALQNALKIVNKKVESVKIVIHGAGAAAMAIANLLMMAGAIGKNIIMLDSYGILYAGRTENMNSYKDRMALLTNAKRITGGLVDALSGADVFIGVSVGNILNPKWVQLMADDPIVFAMANPNPEISYQDARKTKIAVLGTGRSDYPNQINNVLVFPGIFRGALDARARSITDEMKLAAAKAIASLISPKELNPEYIIPKPFNSRVAKVVAEAVKKAQKKNKK